MDKFDFPHLKALDGIRAIAIVLIVWFHIWQLSWLSPSLNFLNHIISLDPISRSGYLGVELFIFLSGFGLYYSYLKRVSLKGEGESLKSFFSKRFARIYPSYLLSIIVIVLILNLLIKSHITIKDVVAHLFFIQNFFKDTYSSINGVFWVLAIEVQFYILFPLISRLFFKRPLTTFVVIFWLSIVYRTVVLLNVSDNLNFYINQLPGFLDLYLSGMLCAHLLPVLYKRIKNNGSFFLSTVISVGSLILMIYLMTLIPSGVNEPITWQAQNRPVISLIFLFFVLSTIFSFKSYQNLFSNRVLIFISTISYNLFIWHQLLARMLIKYSIPSFKTVDPHLDPMWQIEFTALSILISIVTATIITFLFEIPARNYLLKRFVRT